MSNYKALNDLYEFMESLLDEDKNFYLIHPRFMAELQKETKFHNNPDNQYLIDLQKTQKACNDYQVKRTKSNRTCNKEYRIFLSVLSSALLAEMLKIGQELK